LSIVIAIIILLAVIIIHELGHFAAAKACDIEVEEFSIGMGPKLISRQKGETLYAWRLIPIGGMCIMRGEENGEISERSFAGAKVWKRIIVVAAGPVFNFLLSFIAALIVVFCAGADPCTVVSVNEGSPAEQAGLQSGDLIVSYQGSSISNARDLYMDTVLNGIQDDTIDLVVERDGEKLSLSFGLDETDGSGGFSYNMAREKQDFFTSVRYAFGEIKYNLKSAINSIKGLFNGTYGVDDLSGPVGIVSTVGSVYEESVSYGAFSVVMSMLNMVILLSVSVGVVNLLPLPALDGGRLIFLIIECIRRKPCSQKIEGTVHFIGFALLMALAVYIAFNDVLKLF
jgi:regulator of sigma E protease